MSDDNISLNYKKLKQIGNFIYDEQIILGEGSFGKVFQGHDQENRFVAIKRLDLEIFEKDRYLQKQIVSEIEIMKKFNHANIVKFIDLLCSKNSLYIVTELCKDGDLKSLLARKTLQEKEVIQIMIQIVNGFKEMVQHGIIHRDLKPANILNDDGIIKITDFGFARYVDNYTHQLLKSCVGSPLYMAPQILQKMPYSTKCDIWSLGIIFYEMLFGIVPWNGRNETHLLRNIFTKSISFENMQLSDFSINFMRKALVVSQDERMTWQEVFESFDLISGCTLEKKFHFLSSTDDVGSEEEIQKVPTWMGKVFMKKESLSKEIFDQKIKLHIEERTILGYIHFLNVEILQGFENFNDKITIRYCALLSKWVLQRGLRLFTLVQQLIREYDSILEQTKSQIKQTLQKELNYYTQLYVEIRDYIESQLFQIFNIQEQELYDEDYPTDKMILEIEALLLQLNLSIQDQKTRQCFRLDEINQYIDKIQINL